MCIVQLNIPKQSHANINLEPTAQSQDATENAKKAKIINNSSINFIVLFVNLMKGKGKQSNWYYQIF